MIVKDPKIRLITVLGFAILAIILLAAGLPQLELQSGKFFNPSTVAEFIAILNELLSIQVLQYLILVLGLLLTLYLFLLPSRGPEPVKARRWHWMSIVSFMLWMLALYIIRQQMQDMNLELNPPEISVMPGGEAFSNGQGAINPPSPVASFVFSFLVVLVILAGVWFAWRLVRRPRDPLVGITRQARAALNDLQGGVDLRNVILRCYFEMCQVLNQQRGIQREQGMTPREFEGQLVGLGLPEEPVKQLTRLFESVRYGAREPDEQAERIAEGCLNAIVQFGGRMS